MGFSLKHLVLIGSTLLLVSVQSRADISDVADAARDGVITGLICTAEGLAFVVTAGTGTTLVQVANGLAALSTPVAEVLIVGTFGTIKYVSGTDFATAYADEQKEDITDNWDKLEETNKTFYKWVNKFWHMTVGPGGDCNGKSN